MCVCVCAGQPPPVHHVRHDLLGPQHVLRSHPVVKLLLCAVAQRQRRLLQGGALHSGASMEQGGGTRARRRRRQGWPQAHPPALASPPTPSKPPPLTSLCAFLAMAAALSYPILLLSAVTSMRLSCSSCAMRPSLALMPITQLSGARRGWRQEGCVSARKAGHCGQRSSPAPSPAPPPTWPARCLAHQ